jgi:hypothetical protein
MADLRNLQGKVEHVGQEALQVERWRLVAADAEEKVV